MSEHGCGAPGCEERDLKYDCCASQCWSLMCQLAAQLQHLTRGSDSHTGLVEGLLQKAEVWGWRRPLAGKMRGLVSWQPPEDEAEDSEKLAALNVLSRYSVDQIRMAACLLENQLAGNPEAKP